MPKRGDYSPGDSRQPYSDVGGPEARHAQTHDVAREQASNPRGIEEKDDFSEDLNKAAAAPEAGDVEATVSATELKDAHELFPQLDSAELEQLPILKPGTRLEQGAVYLDLSKLARGPFKAIGGQEAPEGHLYVSKRDLDHEMWKRLTGGREDISIERPR
ncbi:MAG: hypothetical protein JF888_01025 [Candidatus Dormibacteraeota bacterium]|uniref:Uncharacterized protein n=2 Tax=Candidatus Dormibacteraceae TaxID=3126998 RepID=A0A934KE93_9BACT|nr:hypothetical protein [Candidatus Dormibacteraeota bacterium]MBJ7601773.1 hypothetical protein [Candidatus Dormibacteraeota bacterium]PZS00866.1 MAG: hypothetical protein DLM67_00395 [Candidatus Dormibacteraeota bacterium]